ncbi:hypothetical protein AeRB84_020507 [Aphanomyces euteiches]|nr:hypothetical protein AeRB84_020507 [Aphanomyces euteiches]
MSRGTEVGSFDELNEEVREIRANTVSKRSRDIYMNSYARFVSWLVIHKQNLVPDAFFDLLGPQPASPPALFASVKSLLMDSNCCPPIHFDRLTAPDFVVWILTLKKKNGDRLSYSALNTHRAGLFNLFRRFGVSMSTTLEKEMSNHFRGLKRSIAESTASGNGRIKVGKDPLSIDTFHFLFKALLLVTDLNAVFARTFMLLAWNLMCRSSNAFGIMLEHREWSNDALRIYFAHMKNDQGGDRPRDPRHVYANPKHPPLCPILALGIYWSCYSFHSNTKQLFPGSNQYERFRKQ